MPGVTAEGFIGKSLAEILAGMEQRERADIDPGLDTSAFSVLGNLNGVVASELAELWELAQAVHEALDPARATDNALDAVAALSGTRRRAATKSTATLTLTLEDGAVVPAGSVVSVDGDPDARFVLLEGATGDDGDDDFPSYEVRAEAETAGVVVANAGTLTVIESPASGWTAVTNADDAEPGTEVEKDPPMRLRREQELAAAGGGTVPGLRAEVSRLDVVRAVEVFENADSITDPDTGLPPHSFEVLVDYDDEAEGANESIGGAIWANKPAGIRAYGETDVTIEDSEGVEHEVSFTQVELVQVFVAVYFPSLPSGWEQPGSDDLAAAIVEASQTTGDPAYLSVGTDVYANAILCALLDAGAHPSVQVGVSLASISDPDDGDPTVEIGLRQRATLDTSDIAFNFEDA